jgi:flavin-dependent dehydrogenase
MTARAQALVVGGGIAGAAMAAHLAQAGRRVLLVERKAGPHDKVCGEFISGEAAPLLRDLHIGMGALGAVAVSAVRVCARDDAVMVPLPFPAFSLSRRVLDEALLARASACGAEVRRGASVRSLTRHDDQWIAELDDGEKIIAGDAFLATGKHDLRGWRRPPGRQGDLVAFKLHWRLSPAQTAALGSCVELFLFPGGYVGLERVEDGIANLCLVIGRRQFKALGSRWEPLLAALRSEVPALRRRLSGATPCWDRPLAIASIPYGFVHDRSDGPWRLGDQAAVIPSFTGGGISIALHSARLAAEIYLANGGADRFQSLLASGLAGRVRDATLISRMLVHPVGRSVAMAAARLMPGLVGAIASRTRIRPRYRVDDMLCADRRFSSPARP